MSAKEDCQVMIEAGEGKYYVIDCFVDEGPATAPRVTLGHVMMTNVDAETSGDMTQKEEKTYQGRKRMISMQNPKPPCLV